jgi:hypothetical protein
MKMRRLILAVALTVGCAAPAMAQDCCDASQVATIRDLNYVARAALNHQGPISARLYAMNQAVSAADYTSWSDPDRGYLLGVMAATPDGSYWRGLLEAYARRLGVTIRSAPLPAPAPAPAPAPPPPVVLPQPPPVTAGAIEAAVRAAVREELAGLQAQVSGLATRVAAVERASGGTLPPAAVSSLEQQGAVFAPDGTLSGFKLITKGAPEGDYFGYMGVNDGALRIFGGIRESIGGSWANRQVDANRNLPIIMHAFERDGAISWDWDPPIFGEDPNPNPYKSLLFYLNGFQRGVGPRPGNGRFPLDILTFEKGRSLRFSVGRRDGTNPDIDVALQLHPGTPDAVSIRVGDQLRRIIVGADGILRVGAVTDENQ